MTLADDTADRAFATDQDGLDVAAVLVGNHVGDEPGAAGKMHDLDIVAGAVEQVAGLALVLCEVGGEQRVVGIAQSAQQIIERTLARLGGRFWPRQHGSVPVSPKPDNNRPRRFFVFTTEQTTRQGCDGFNSGTSARSS